MSSAYGILLLLKYILLTIAGIVTTMVFGQPDVTNSDKLIVPVVNNQQLRVPFCYSRTIAWQRFSFGKSGHYRIVRRRRQF